MISSIFQLGDTLAREIMVPRIDMLALEVMTPLAGPSTRCYTRDTHVCRI